MSIKLWILGFLTGFGLGVFVGASLKQAEDDKGWKPGGAEQKVLAPQRSPVEEKPPWAAPGGANWSPGPGRFWPFVAHSGTA